MPLEPRAAAEPAQPAHVGVSVGSSEGGDCGSSLCANAAALAKRPSRIRVDFMVFVCSKRVVRSKMPKPYAFGGARRRGSATSGLPGGPRASVGLNGSDSIREATSNSVTRSKSPANSKVGSSKGAAGPAAVGCVVLAAMQPQDPHSDVFESQQAAIGA